MNEVYVSLREKPTVIFRTLSSKKKITNERLYQLIASAFGMDEGKTRKIPKKEFSPALLDKLELHVEPLKKHSEQLIGKINWYKKDHQLIGISEKSKKVIEKGAYQAVPAVTEKTVNNWIKQLPQTNTDRPILLDCEKGIVTLGNLLEHYFQNLKEVQTDKDELTWSELNWNEKETVMAAFFEQKKQLSYWFNEENLSRTPYYLEAIRLSTRPDFIYCFTGKDVLSVYQTLFCFLLNLQLEEMQEKLMVCAPTKSLAIQLLKKRRLEKQVMTIVKSEQLLPFETKLYKLSRNQGYCIEIRYQEHCLLREYSEIEQPLMSLQREVINLLQGQLSGIKIEQELKLITNFQGFTNCKNSKVKISSNQKLENLGLKIYTFEEEVEK